MKVDFSFSMDTANPADAELAAAAVAALRRLGGPAVELPAAPPAERVEDLVDLAAGRQQLVDGIARLRAMELWQASDLGFLTESAEVLAYIRSCGTFLAAVQACWAERGRFTTVDELAKEDKEAEIWTATVMTALSMHGYDLPRAWTA